MRGCQMTSHRGNHGHQAILPLNSGCVLGRKRYGIDYEKGKGKRWMMTTGRTRKMATMRIERGSEKLGNNVEMSESDVVYDSSQRNER